MDAAVDEFYIVAVWTEFKADDVIGKLYEPEVEVGHLYFISDLKSFQFLETDGIDIGGEGYSVVFVGDELGLVPEDHGLNGPEGSGDWMEEEDEGGCGAIVDGFVVFLELEESVVGSQEVIEFEFIGKVE